jgi:hypothetical protein
MQLRNRFDRRPAEIRIAEWFRSEELEPVAEYQQRLCVSARGSAAVKGASMLKTSLLIGAVLFASAARADVVISTDPTRNMSCSAGVCTPTAPKANLNDEELAKMLASGDVKVVGDSDTKDIKFNVPFSWTSIYRLTLDSYRSVFLRQRVSVTGTGGLSIITSDGGRGNFFFEKNGRVEFWDLKGSLFINGNSNRLVKNIHQLAEAIATNAAGAYALADDYDASKDGNYSQSPVPTEFTGTFEGLGHAIRRLHISTNTAMTDLGLFAFVIRVAPCVI